MLRRWVEKNIDLFLLREDIKNFFVAADFDVKAELFEEQCRILVKPRRKHDVREKIVVTVRGNANDFVIEFSAGEQARSAILLGFLTTILGGGRLVLKGLKSQEALERLEKIFWSYIGRRVDALTDSAKAG